MLVHLSDVGRESYLNGLLSIGFGRMVFPGTKKI